MFFCIIRESIANFLNDGTRAFDPDGRIQITDHGDPCPEREPEDMSLCKGRPADVLCRDGYLP